MKKIKTHSCWNQHAQKKIQNTKNPFSGLINSGSTKSPTYYFFLTPVANKVVRRWYSLHGRLRPPSELFLFVIEAKMFFNLEKVLGKCSCFFTALGRRNGWVLRRWKRKLSACFILWIFFLLLSTGHYTPLDNRVNQARFHRYQELKALILNYFEF